MRACVRVGSPPACAGLELQSVEDEQEVVPSKAQEEEKRLSVFVDWDNKAENSERL